jgi:hypothetical protein
MREYIITYANVFAGNAADKTCFKVKAYDISDALHQAAAKVTMSKIISVVQMTGIS